MGNVVAVVSDRLAGVDINEGGDGPADYYAAEVLQQQDYYSFGMMMPGRAVNSSFYRYGFNGKEKDNEVKGEGTQYDYGFRIYDPRLGRFLSVDPLTEDYPELTPYQFASNTPIWALDLDGLEGLIATGMPLGSSGVSHGMVVSSEGAQKITQSLAQWWNSPASVEQKKAIAYQINYHSSGVDFDASTFDGLTKGQYYQIQFGLSALVYAQSAPGTLRIPFKSQPQTPHVVGLPISKSKQKVVTSAEVHATTGGTPAGEATTEFNLTNVNSVGGKKNCVNCAIATDNYLKGNNSSALDSKAKYLSVLEKEYNRKFTFGLTIEQIKARVNKPGEKIGIVFGNRGAGKEGHVFNVINTNGKINFLDGQSGKLADLTGQGYINFGFLPTGKK